MSVVRSVLGDVAPESLGRVLMHEHLLCDIRPPSWHAEHPYGREIVIEERFAIDYGEVHAPGNLMLDGLDLIEHELRQMKRDGGDCVVDLSCGGLHPDPLGLAELSRRTGVTIVMGCGWYVDEYQDPANADRTVDDLAAEMIESVERGGFGTDVRAGIIGEIGCQSPWTPLEQRVMEAAVVAMQATGASLAVHPGRDADQPQEVADFLTKRGVAMDRVVMSHIDRTIFDDERLFRLADTGLVLEYDLFGMETTWYKWNPAVDMPNDGARVAALRRLRDRGHLAQIAISQDICYRSRLTRYGGHGYGHLFRNVVPLLLRRGFDKGEVDKILIETPRRLLSLDR